MRFINREYRSRLCREWRHCVSSEKKVEIKGEAPKTQNPPAQKTVGKQRAKRSAIELLACFKMRHAPERAFRLIT